jgi:recombination protein RecA
MSSDFLSEIVDRFGDAVLVDNTDKVDVIPTGSISLDVSIGVGGIPRGKITELFGSESSGKTTLAMSIVKNALKLGLRALYVDAENMLDYGLLKDMVGQEFTKEQLVILNPETAEDAFNMIEMGLNSNSFELIVLDSVGSMAPKKEQEDDFEDANVALLARLVTKFLRRNAHVIAEKNVALLLLNQVRSKIGAYMASFETPGGHALKHFTSLRISLSRGVEMKVGNETVGIMTKFVIKKNKLSAPFRSFTIPIVFGKGIDEYSDAVDFCSMLGVIKKKGSYYKFEDVSLGQGKLQAGDYLEKHPETLDKIKEGVYNVLNKYTSIDVDAVVDDSDDTEEVAKDE